MRISLNWLQTLVDIDLSPPDLAEILTLAGFEVDDIEDRRPWADGVVVGKILSCDPHPNADKLRVCQVEIGQAEPANIVCGAANVKSGLYVPVATLGTYLPAVDLTIKKAKLRGVPSLGMICSLAELGLEKEAEGIHSFDPTQGAEYLGADARPLLGLNDVILDIASTANRADALSMVGVAREVAALTGATLNLPATPQLKIPTQKNSVTIELADPDLCPAYIATVLENVSIGPSPDWLQQRLTTAGTRPINNVVDITNYILLEWGQPLHAFDAEALQHLTTPHPLTLGVRYAQGQETLVTLDGQKRRLQDQTLLITANDQPIALGGVMGGAATEVKNSTTRLVLEAALFGSVVIRRSARSQSLRTEASARYERGVNASELERACLHALELLVTLTGARILDQQTTDHRTPLHRIIELRLDRVNQVLGQIKGEQGEPTFLTASQVTPLLAALGFELTAIDGPIASSKVWQVKVPPHRHHDIEREIDLVEEVARLYGYDRFCDTLPAQTKLGFLSGEDALTRKLREALRSIGLTELLHYSWVKPGIEGQVVVVNPLLVEFSALRQDLLTGLLNAFQFNLEQGNGPLQGFEMGQIFWQVEDSLQESRSVAGILGGDPAQGRWMRDRCQDYSLTWFAAKGLLDRAFAQLGLQVEYRADAPDSRWHPGRTAALISQGSTLGYFGQIHPQIQKERDFPNFVYAFELNLDLLLEQLARQQKRATLFSAYSSYPAADRDLAFFIDSTVSVAEIEQTIWKATGGRQASLLKIVELFDEYQGEHVPVGQRSLAFRLVYQSRDRTLTDAEVNPLHQKVREALEKQFQVSLRS
ncbi:MAG: phenylalanine--tRNA ligase subunit beta [Acaryochloridaceae cyanobacterium SU_2_1]|nr:phenylalanine--tRNA ligase subunit beta [Acaryochloridaceae cyanobacterium SU_2_1]